MSSTPHDLKIRLGLPGEHERALEITLAAYVEYEKVLRPEYWESYREHIVDTLSADLGEGHQLVAESDGQVVGTALYYPPGTSFGEDVEDATMSPNCPEVRLLAVAPEGRGLGVGRALMVECVDRARKSGAPGLVLHAMAMMKTARSLYEDMGFVRAPELDFQPAEFWFVDGFRLDF